MTVLRGKRIQKRKLNDGAAKPLVTTSTAFSPHDQIIEEEQSFMMVQTLLLVSVAGFAWLRNLFPEGCYDLRKNADICADARFLYRKTHCITSDSHRNNNIEPEQLNKQWAPRVLIRGRTQEADKLLEWLDIILEGILNKSLSRVCFSIYTEKENPSQALETYDFSVQYLQDASGGNQQIVGLGFSGCSGEPLTMMDTRSKMKKIIRQLMQMDNLLPDLPERHYLICHLFQHKDAPQGHVYRGFHSCVQQPSVCMQASESWDVADLGSMNSHFHNVALQVGYLPPTAGPKPNPKQAIPTFQNSLRHRSPLQHEGLDWSLGSPTSELNPAGAGVEYLNEFDRQGSVSVGEHEDTENKGRLMPNAAIQKLSEDQSHRRNNSLIPTQELPSNDLQQSKSCTLDPLIFKLLTVKRDGILQSLGRISYNMDKVGICCECEFKEKEGSMVGVDIVAKCECCDGWQHNHCYGYSLKIPSEQHFCYSCLLIGFDERRLEELRRLARFRRALWVAYEQGYPRSMDAFAKMLGYDGKATAGIVHRMKEEGYLSMATKTRLQLVDSPEQTITKNRDYFNPMTLIKQFYTSSNGRNILRTDSPKPSRKRTRRDMGVNS